jgi:hypothetical protein
VVLLIFILFKFSPGYFFDNQNVMLVQDVGADVVAGRLVAMREMKLPTQSGLGRSDAGKD